MMGPVLLLLLPLLVALLGSVSGVPVFAVAAIVLPVVLDGDETEVEILPDADEDDEVNDVVEVEEGSAVRGTDACTDAAELELDTAAAVVETK